MKNLLKSKIHKSLVGGIAVLTVGTAANRVCMLREKKKPGFRYGQMIHSGGKNFCVSIEGNGKRKIILFGGWGTASPVLDFKPLTEALKTEYTVVVIEGLGYGRSDDADSPRTVENITEEIHTLIKKLGFTSYTLMGHSIMGIFLLYYVNQYKDEVEAVIGIDPTVPDQIKRGGPLLPFLQKGVAILTGFLNKTGILRLVSKIGSSLLLPDFPNEGIFTQEERNAYRQISLHRLVNQTVMGELHELKNSCGRVADMRLPADMPVLYFLSSESVNSMKWWYEVHQKQLDGVKNSKLLVLEGSHYLHHTQSQIMTSRIRDYMPPDNNSLHSMQSGSC